MLEVVIPGIRHGEAKVNSSTAYRGQLMYLAGVDADGYQLLQVPYSTVTAAKAYFPINKYYFAEDYADNSSTVDCIAKGSTIVYYEGGEYITDRINVHSFAGAAYWNSVETTLTSATGAKLYRPGSSTAYSVLGIAHKCYVSTGNGGGFKLFGSTACYRGAVTTALEGKYVAIATGFYYKDSANATVRFRIERNLKSGPYDSVTT